MDYFDDIPKSGDPSDLVQNFRKININVLCCRYWWLERWAHHNMSFPYWRLYWNKTGGAYVYQERKFRLEPGYIYIIPSNTVFSSDIENKSVKGKVQLHGGNIIGDNEEEEHIQAGDVMHFFVHFTLDEIFHDIQAKIYRVPVTHDLRNTLSAITDWLKQGTLNFNFSSSLAIYGLIINSLKLLPDEAWISRKMDTRVLKAINYIEAGLENRIKNTELAKNAFMSTNSFSRLFKENVGESPQKYLTKRRIEKSCSLLHHTNYSIDEIAVQCGFFDRYHFSKIFKSIVKTTPAVYRKGLDIENKVTNDPD